MTRISICVLCVIVLAGCNQPTANSNDPEKPNSLARLSEALDPDQAARGRYERSVAAYQRCMAANQKVAAACEAERNVMATNASVLAAAMQRPAVVAPATAPPIILPPPPTTTQCRQYGGMVQCQQF